MTDPEPIPLHPARIAPRGEFPPHVDLPGRRVLSAAEAKRQARQRLDDWRRCHPGGRDE
jgi:hypothetical protein